VKPARREEELVGQGDGCHVLSSLFPLAFRGVSVLWTSSFAVQLFFWMGSQVPPAALPMRCAAPPTARCAFHPAKGRVGPLGASTVHISALEAYGPSLDWLEVRC